MVGIDEVLSNFAKRGGNHCGVPRTLNTRDLGFPNHIAGKLIQCRDSYSCAARRYDQAVFVDQRIHRHEMIAVSAGVRGTQIRLAPEDYIRATAATVGPIGR